jgi:hypothetical protein
MGRTPFVRIDDVGTIPSGDEATYVLGSRRYPKDAGAKAAAEATRRANIAITDFIFKE